MSEEFENMEDVGLEGEYEDLAHHDLMEIFEELSFKEKWAKVAEGLKLPSDAGQYKWAKLQILRLSAPICAVLVPCFAVLLLMIFVALTPETERTIQVEVIEPEEVPELEEIEEIKEEPPEPPEPVEVEFDTPEVNFDNPSPTPPTDFSPQPVEFDSVAITKSPVIMRGIFGSRSPGARGAAYKAYGGFGEDAVMRALRWLKKEQNSDGSWNKVKPAMTALALLTYLAHGETPSSPEFGPTVERAIRFLVESQNEDGSFQGRDGHDYTHPIATYALCEAYALTKVPMVRDAAMKGLYRIVEGQNASGGFNYNLKPTTRDDTSYMGWCAQALKAGYMAGLSDEGVEQAMKKAIKGFEKNYSGDYDKGGFGYTGGSLTHGMTGVGVLCLQLLGAADSKEVKGGLANLEQATYNWDGGGKFNKLYYWYYITQAKFHHGGDTWKTWNKLFAPTLVKNQTIINNGIMGPKDEMVDIGYWDMPQQLTGHTDGVVMNTCLCTLQLEVYYRYLPTFKKPEPMVIEEAAAGADDGVKIEIDL